MIVNQVVKMQRHPATHPYYPIMKEVPPPPQANSVGKEVEPS